MLNINNPTLRHAVWGLQYPHTPSVPKGRDNKRFKNAGIR